MSNTPTEPDKPNSPWRLNSSRVVLLVLGAVLVLIVISSLMGGLANYQQLRDAAREATDAAPVESVPATPAN